VAQERVSRSVGSQDDRGKREPALLAKELFSSGTRRGDGFLALDKLHRGPHAIVTILGDSFRKLFSYLPRARMDEMVNAELIVPRVFSGLQFTARLLAD
jgi:hypothetical protein